MATITADLNEPHRIATERYTRVAITLHWLIAAAIFYNLASGLLNDALPRWFFVFHISSGMTILVLSVVRVGWRLMHKPPPFLPMKRWENTLAHTNHFLLYAAILLMPFSGWAMISANPPVDSAGAAYAAAHPKDHAPEPAKAKPGTPQTPAPPAQRPAPRMFWGLFPVPLIAPIHEIGRTAAGVPEQREVHEWTETTHTAGGWIMLALLVLHITGALKHQYIDRKPELARIGIGRGRDT